MATIAIETQLEDEVSKFYLVSLEWLQLKELDEGCEDFTRFYYNVRDLINPNTHFTTLDKLGPGLLYIFLKTRGVLLVLPAFLDLWNVEYYKFTTDLKKILKLYPEFSTRDKKTIIKKYIATILKSFKVEERIHSHALTLFDHFYPLVQYTKEEIVAAVICVLTAISFDLTEVSMRFICNRAGIRQSSLHKSIIRKIYPYLGIPSNCKLRTSFELIKGKIRKKTSLGDIKIRTVEEEVEDLWRSGFSINKIIELVEIPKVGIIDILESSLGDYRNYIVRYGITQQEIDTACLLRKKGLSYRQIVPRLNRPLKLIKKIVEENLENYETYKYIPHQDRVKHTNLASAKVYNSPELVGQLYDDLLKKVRAERNLKVPLSRLAYLLLHHEANIRKNISKTCVYLSKAKISRTKKTILGLVLALSFPHVPQLRIATLIGISPTAIRHNLTGKNLAVGNIAQHIDLAIKEQIDLESIFDYFEIIMSLIKEERIPHIESTKLVKVLDKIKKIKTNIYDITRNLREKGLYRDEGLVLATAIYMSCPSLNERTIKHLITGSVNRKVKSELITGLQKEISAQETSPNNQISLVEQLGNMIEEQGTDILCKNCGKFVYLQVYRNNKKIFVCKHCLL